MAHSGTLGLKLTISSRLHASGSRLRGNLAFSNLPFVDRVLAVSPDLESFVGQLVKIVAVVGEHDGSEPEHVFVPMGRVLEISAAAY